MSPVELGAAVDRASRFPCVSACSKDEERKTQALVSDLEGSMLKSSSAWPYYMLAAWEAPAGLARFSTLLLLWPLAWLVERLQAGPSTGPSVATKMGAWIAFAGVRERDIRSIARAVLPKFYAEDVHPQTWRVVSSFGRRYLLTTNPRIMVEPFATEYLGIDHVLGSELQIHAGTSRATGFLLHNSLEAAIHALFRAGVSVPDVRVGHRVANHPFFAACKEGYIVAPSSPKALYSPASQLCKPLVFHDGRLVQRPTPAFAFFILLWLPFGTILACIRLIAGFCLPTSIALSALRGLGLRLIVKGDVPSEITMQNGVVFASTHRTLMDPVFISYALAQPITAVTFSLSRLSEMTSPIPTIRLSRSREQDASIMKKHLEKGHLVICPEGTTTREPFLLRFSALFAELSGCIVPVATRCELSMFHATTARGWKGLDSFYFYLNPFPAYEITFVKQLPQYLTCAGGKTSLEVANFVQSLLASTLGFKTTKLTRKDKYSALVGGGDDHTTTTTTTTTSPSS